MLQCVNTSFLIFLTLFFLVNFYVAHTVLVDMAIWEWNTFACHSKNDWMRVPKFTQKSIFLFQFFFFFNFFACEVSLWRFSSSWISAFNNYKIVFSAVYNSHIQYCCSNSCSMYIILCTMQCTFWQSYTVFILYVEIFRPSPWLVYCLFKFSPKPLTSSLPISPPSLPPYISFSLPPITFRLPLFLLFELEFNDVHDLIFTPM